MGDLPQPGDFVGGRYKIDSLLGEGGMGAVFAATNGATGRPVAIKWMLPAMAKSQEALARFLAEARTTARIEHPNVIQILDVGQDGEAPFLVMERLRGESLGECLARRTRLAPAEAVDIVLAACQGIQEAHGEGIIHRDLKPDNIFLCQGKDGTPRPPKVLDFGISKLFDETGGGQKLTQTGAIMGTPLYMSPEQLDGRTEPDAAFDVYAMGVVLYESLSGASPYDADTFFVLVQQIVGGQFRPLKTAAPWLPDPLVQVVERSMHPNRAQRYTTMRDLIAELQRVRPGLATADQTGPMPAASAIAWGGAPTGAPSSGFGAPTPPQTGPMGAQTGPMGAQTGPIGQTGGMGGTGPIPAPGGHAQDSREGAQSWRALAALVGLGGLSLVALIVFFALRSGPDAPTPIPGGGSPIAPAGGALAPGGQADVALQFSGSCAPVFQANSIVSVGSGAIVVSSVSTGLTGSITVKLPGAGVHAVNSRQMMNQQSLINVLAGDRMWMSVAQDTAAVLSGGADPISGVIEARSFNAATGQSDLVFRDVKLQNMEDGSICGVSGNLVTRGTTY